MELETFGILVAVAFSIWVLVGIFRDKGGFSTDNTPSSPWNALVVFVVTSLFALLVYLKWGEWNAGVVIFLLMAIASLRQVIKNWRYR